MISGHANIEMAIKSLKHGAFEFIEKRSLNKFYIKSCWKFKFKSQNKEYEKTFSSYDLIGDSKNISSIRDQLIRFQLKVEYLLWTLDLEKS